MLYEPSKRLDSPTFNTQILAINNQKIRVHVQNAGQAKALIYFGGNAEDVANNIPALSDALENYSTYFVNYRGFSGSSGKPTEAGISADALAIYDALATQHKSISLIGRSLGTGVATYLSARRPIARLALVTPYDSIVNVAQKRFPYYPLSWILIDQYHSTDNAGKISAPTLMLLAQWDGVIPLSHSQNLAKHFTATKPRIEIFPETGHNAILQHENYLPVLSRFFEHTL